MDVVGRSGYADFKWAVQLNRFSLRLVGLWPQKATSSREKLNANVRLFGMVIGITCVCTTPSLHSLVRVWGDITAMVDNLLFTLPLITLSMKMLILWWKKETLSPLMTMIARDWIRPKSGDDRNAMVRCAQTARFIIAGSYVVILSTLALLCVACGFGFTLRYVTNATDTGRPLPMQAHYVYDVSASPQFELTFLIQCITLMTFSLCYTGVDNFIGLLIFHICGQLEILTGRMYRMREAGNFIDALRINVEDHVRLIRAVATIEDTFTSMLLLAFVFFGALFCVYGFLLVTVMFEEGNLPMRKVVFLIMAVSTVLIHMCVYCAVGELLVIKYEEVYNAVYECEWYMLETREARSLIFLMIRTSKPLCITAGKMFPMTMSTFCSILKTSGGYISVLLANRD